MLAGPATALVRAGTLIGPEIEGADVLREVLGDALGVLVSNQALHGRTLAEIADQVGDNARGVFLRDLTRRGQEVPVTPDTIIYLGDVMTLVGATHDVQRAATKVGEVLRYGDRTDIAFLAAGIAVGLLVGLLSFKAGSFAISLGGAGGTLLVGLICGWLRTRRPTVGNYPPAAEQTLSDIGLGGFIAAIGLANGPRRLRPFNPTVCYFCLWGWCNTCPADDCDHRGVSRPAPEPGHHLWRARGSNDGRRSRHRSLRKGGQSDAGPWGRRALCCWKRTPDHPRPRDRGAYPHRVMSSARR